LTLGLFARTTTFEFLNYDDPLFVLDHALVREGLTWTGVVEAFTTAPVDYWRPLSWLSHMLDIELFGLQAGGHHAMNVVWHTGATVMVFLALFRLTTTLWPAAATAALFGIHPLHVESVAWVAERKDVMCGFFWFLTLWLYTRWVQAPSHSRFACVLGAFALGALSKPMIVTLPFVLLLLDVWPLRRLVVPAIKPDSFATEASQFVRDALPLLKEKLPLFAAAAILSVVANRNVADLGLDHLYDHITMPPRGTTALVAYARYVEKAVLPSHLAVFYPLPAKWPATTVLWSAALISTITLLSVLRLSKQPWIIVGWFWFLGALVPVIGIVRISAHAMADRYSYVPVVGLFIGVAWSLHAWSGKNRARRGWVALAGGFALVLCTVVTWRQLDHWGTSSSLFAHALQVTGKNVLAHYGYGRALHAERRAADAIPHYYVALEWNLKTWEVNNHLGTAFAELGRLDEAIFHFEQSAKLGEFPDAGLNLGRALALRGRHDEARSKWRAVLANGDSSPRIRRFLELVLEDARRADADAEWLGHAALMHEALGRRAEAVAAWRALQQLQPGHPEAARELGRLAPNQQ
jgi:Flp pilus assembly protein TadD